MQHHIDMVSQNVRGALAGTASAIRDAFPTVNNATLNIKQGDSVLRTFTANAVEDKV